VICEIFYKSSKEVLWYHVLPTAVVLRLSRGEKCCHPDDLNLDYPQQYFLDTPIITTEETHTETEDRQTERQT